VLYLVELVSFSGEPPLEGRGVLVAVGTRVADAPSSAPVGDAAESLAGVGVEVSMGEAGGPKSGVVMPAIADPPGPPSTTAASRQAPNRVFRNSLIISRFIAFSPEGFVILSLLWTAYDGTAVAVGVSGAVEDVEPGGGVAVTTVLAGTGLEPEPVSIGAGCVARVAVGVPKLAISGVTAGELT
jgi:hypothetical protein